MTKSAVIGAIDAGSNAMRVVVAEAVAGGLPRKIAGKRLPVRLGHRAFTMGELDPATIDAAVAAFQTFRQLFDSHGVEHYRAVATSALRQSRNREIVVHRIFQEAGIELEIITGSEEARLIRKAVRNAFRNRPKPATVLDLGGGSLEVIVRNVARWSSASLPIGTVRLVETLDLGGAIDTEGAAMVRRYVRTLLQTFAPSGGVDGFTPVVACGGNAEAYARLIGEEFDGMAGFSVESLEKLLGKVLPADVNTRMKDLGVRQDRADVMGVAGLILATAAHELGAEQVLVPKVGLRDALLFEAAAGIPSQKESAQVARAKAALTAARMFSARVGHDLTHSERVRELAVELFERLRDVHGLPSKLRIVLELAAVLHDVGEVIHRRSHHKHGEYMVLWSRLPGLDSPELEMVAALVRAHRKSMPTVDKHIAFTTLNKTRRDQVMQLLPLLRMADSFESSKRQDVRIDSLSIGENEVDIVLTGDGDAPIDTDELLRKSDLFEKQYGLALSVTEA